LAAGAILASIVQVSFVTADDPPLRDGLQRIADDSERLPTGWDGAVVVFAECKQPPPPSKKKNERPIGPVELTIVIRLQRPLAVGDVLLVSGQPLGIVAGLLPDDQLPTDIVLGSQFGKQLDLQPGTSKTFEIGKAQEVGQTSIQARSAGPYSLISEQPLKWKSADAAQTLAVPHIRWLRSHGMHATLAELLALKCDDVGNRSRVHQAAKGRGSFPAPAAPRSLWILLSHLTALGFRVQITSQGDHVGLSLAPATDAELLAQSHGQVTKPETIHYRDYRYLDQGLFCNAIFGKHHRDRSRRFGHIALPVGVVPYLWRMGSPSVLQRLLHLDAATIERIICCEALTFRCRGGPGDSIRLVDVPKHGAPQPQPADGEEPLGTGAEAIAALLAHVPPSRVPPGLRGRLNYLVQHTVLVLPPDLRPLVLLDSGNFATSDYNDLYRRVINRANRLRKLRELDAPQAILLNEQQQVQRAVDALMANGSLPSGAIVYDDSSGERRARDLLGVVLGEGSPGKNSKTVDYAGRARAVEDASLPQDIVRLPRRMVDVLGLSTSSPVLLTTPVDGDNGPHTPGFLALRPTPDDGAAIRLSPRAFARLQLNAAAGSDVPTCVVHRPLTAPALDEARQLLSTMMDDALAPRPPPLDAPSDRGPLSPNWLDAEGAQHAIASLIEALCSGHVVHLHSERGLLCGGPGIITFSEATGEPSARKAWRDIPAPCATNP
jgi:hypothetical protein